MWHTLARPSLHKPDDRTTKIQSCRSRWDLNALLRVVADWVVKIIFWPGQRPKSDQISTQPPKFHALRRQRKEVSSEEPPHKKEKSGRTHSSTSTSTVQQVTPSMDRNVTLIVENESQKEVGIHPSILGGQSVNESLEYIQQQNQEGNLSQGVDFGSSS